VLVLVEAVIFYVADVDTLYDRALAAGYQPAAVPHDAEWGERFFHQMTPMATNSVSFRLCSQFPSNSSSKRPAMRRCESVLCSPLNLGGNHGVQDNRTPVCSARWHFPPPGPHKHRRATGNYTNTVTDVRLHFKVVSITLRPDERSSVLAANGILYQMSGSIEVSLGGEAKMLTAEEGLFIAGGKRAALTAGSGVPSTFLHFSQARSVRSSQPFRKAKRPNRSKREKENSSTRQEGKRKICVQ
jgi:hypothetical protein